MPVITAAIDPVTRIEGHLKVEVKVDTVNGVQQVVDAFSKGTLFRGFEKLLEGRAPRDATLITSRICGVCPMAHHMASTKALDSLYQASPPPAARKIRELVYSTFMVEDHALHFYFLGGPDFVVGPTAPAAERNVLGVIARVGLDVGKRVIDTRRKLRELITLTGGKVIHPVFGLPGGVAKRVTKEDQLRFQDVSAEAIEFAKFTLQVFENVVLKNSDYVNLIVSDAYTHRTHYMGMVDENNHVNFYDGWLRVVSPEGKEWARFKGDQYLDYVAEHVEPWSYMKFCYMKPKGWKGFVDGADSGVYCVAPLARLNVADGMATPLAQEAYQKFFATLGGKPVHHTLANHWARVIELLYAAERMKQLADDPEITDDNVRNIPTAVPREGFGVVEAPRGTLFHHYQTDERGRITKANLIVATQNNAARIAMSVDKAAKGLINGAEISEGLLNMIEMAFRAYDPCNGCATHSLPGSMPLMVRVHDQQKKIVATLRRDSNGEIHKSVG
jgi:F420-non-reducing hydrogenase large subunit